MGIYDIERPRYYERQYLGASDLLAEQMYHTEAARRHLIGHHTWGILVGLTLEAKPRPGGAPGADVIIKPGMAVDGLGRTLLLLQPYPIPIDLFAGFAFDPLLPDGRWLRIALRYVEERSRQPRYGYGQCDINDQTSRVRETFRIIVGPTSIDRDPIVVDGRDADAMTEVADGSVPYQTFGDPTDAARWLVTLGWVKWFPRPLANQPGDYFVAPATPEDKAKASSDRQYVGVVAESVLAPAGTLRIRPRAAFADPDAADFASIEGRLRVDGRVVAKKNVELHGGRLWLRSTAPGGAGEIPLWLQRRVADGGTIEDLRVHIGDEPKPTTRLSVGTGPADGSAEKVILAVKGNDTVDIPTGTLDFKSNVRQMINLWTRNDGVPAYGIGIQSGTQYYRTDGEFCWFRGGVHANGQSDPGGGTLQMRLDDQARIHLGATTRQMLNLWSTNYGIGVQDFTLYQRSDGDFCWFRGGVHSSARSDAGIGGTLAMRLDQTAKLEIAGALQTGAGLRVGANLEVVGTAVMRGPLQLFGTVLDFRDAGGGIDSDVLLMQRQSRGANQSDLRVTIGNNIDGDDRFTVGPLYFVDGNYRECFVVQNNGDVTIRGRLGTNGQLPTPRTVGWGGGIHTWDVEAEGTIWSRSGYQSGPRDLAENYESTQALVAGDVVRVDGTDSIARATSAEDSSVLGIISERPGFVLNAVRTDAGTPAPNMYPVALAGRTPCKVTDENGPIRPGDLLTSSSTPGYAMRARQITIDGAAFYRPATILGKALGSHDVGAGMIEVFIARG
jgi:hypothetical protein